MIDFRKDFMERIPISSLGLKNAIKQNMKAETFSKLGGATTWVFAQSCVC